MRAISPALSTLVSCPSISTVRLPSVTNRISCAPGCMCQGAPYAWRHFQDIDHRLLDLLILALQIAAQDLSKFWPALQPLGQYGARASGCCRRDSCSELQKSTA